ncbi:MAG: hypothetical protein JNM29_22580 [Candidatus Odyssella sp.]|nr:hypothetical protein [Candidatus Odyssella sp.]
MPTTRAVAKSGADGAERAAEPLVTFYRLIPEARLPQRADRSAGGMLPVRALRYCAPVTTASAFGWYVFPPIDFALKWDGADIVWTYKDAGEWYPLGAAQFPDFSRYFDKHAPKDVKSFSPPFIGAGTKPANVQLWSGLIARTVPGWSLLVRPPANLPRSRGYDLYEGIIETDRWFGPLLTNLRLARTDSPVEIRRDYPLLQVQPIPREVYANETLNRFEIVEKLADFTAADWQRYRETVVGPNVDPHRRRGAYAVKARRRAKRAAGPGA